MATRSQTFDASRPWSSLDWETLRAAVWEADGGDGSGILESLYRDSRASGVLDVADLEFFYAAAHHCANIQNPDKCRSGPVGVFVGRIKSKNRKGLQDQSWKWAGRIVQRIREAERTAAASQQVRTLAEAFTVPY
jgi:hypothetical protein